MCLSVADLADVQQSVSNFVFINGEVYHGRAQLLQQHTAYLALGVLLVLAHKGKDVFGVAKGVVGQGHQLGGDLTVTVEVFFWQS